MGPSLVPPPGLELLTALAALGWLWSFKPLLTSPSSSTSAGTRPLPHGSHATNKGHSPPFSLSWLSVAAPSQWAIGQHGDSATVPSSFMSACPHWEALTLGAKLVTSINIPSRANHQGTLSRWRPCPPFPPRGHFKRKIRGGSFPSHFSSRSFSNFSSPIVPQQCIQKTHSPGLTPTLCHLP